MLCAVHCSLAMREIALVGTRGADDTDLLQTALAGEFLPDRVLVSWDPGREETRGLPEQVPLLAGKTLVDGRAAVYVCRNYACQAPVTNAAALSALLSAPGLDL